MVRLKEQWEQQYEQWRNRSLRDHRYAYLWCDGVYPKAGLQGDKTSFLVVLGANENCEKKPLAIVEGYRESTESWSDPLRDLKSRGLKNPALFVGDCALGLWGAIDKVCPKADHQRCWVHKMRNLLVHFPKGLQDEVRALLREMYYATTKKQGESLMGRFAKQFGKEYPRAVDCLLEDQEALLTFYAYPRQHWVSLKTTNPIESIFAPVKLCTNAAKPIRSPCSALFLIFQLIVNAQKRWRRLNAPELVAKVIRGVRYENGQETTTTKKSRKKVAA